MNKRFLILLTILLSTCAVGILLFIALSKPTFVDVASDVMEEAVKQQSSDNTENPDDTGDVAFKYGNSDKFVNQEIYESEVPEDIRNTIDSTVPDDLLSGYPDLKFISYDPTTKYVESENDTYHVTLEYYDAQYTVHAIMLEYYKE